MVLPVACLQLCGTLKVTLLLELALVARNSLNRQSWWQVTVANATLQHLVWFIDNLRDWSLFLVQLWFGELRLSCSLVFKNCT